MKWWLMTLSAGTPSHQRNKYSIEKNLVDSEPAALTLAELSPASLENYLQARAARLGPQTLNRLRRFVLAAFNAAKRAGRFAGPNPAPEVKRRKVPQRLPDFLRAEEVPRVLKYLSARWRPLFASAIYTGMRTGELLGLRKSDVDFNAGLISIARSYDRETTKGHRAEAIPMARELVPYLKHAIDSSPSDRVFPKVDERGSMMGPDYGHLAPGYLQAEVDRLQFNPPAAEGIAADDVA